MDKSLQYSLANLYQKARDLYANSPVAKPIAQFQANNRAAVQKVQVPDTLQSFVQGANQGAVGFTGLEKKIPLGYNYTPQTTAGKVANFAGGAVGYALGAGKLLGPVEKAIQGAVMVPKLAKSAPVLSRAANFVARKAAPALIAEAATAIPTSIIQSRVDQKPVLPIYAQNVAGNLAGRAVGEGIGVAAPLVGRAGKFAIKETKDAIKKTDAEMFNRWINLAISEGDAVTSRLGTQPRNAIGNYGKKIPLIKAVGSGDILHPDVPLLKLVFEPGTQPQGIGTIIPATKLKEMPELAQYVQGPANKAAERLYKQAYSGGFIAGPKAWGFNNPDTVKFSSLMDKKPRFEVDDSGAKMVSEKVARDRAFLRGDGYRKQIDTLQKQISAANRQGNSTLATQLENQIYKLKSPTPYITVGDVLDHPKLFEQYPDLKNHQIEFSNKVDQQGAFVPSRDGGKIIVSKRADGKQSTLLHEIQHAIQEKEGFARGGSPEGMTQFQIDLKGKLRDEITGVKIRLENMERQGINNPQAKSQLLELQTKLKNDYESIRKTDDLELYKRLSGEVEARAVQRRMDMNPAQRLQTDPYAAEMKATGMKGPQDAIVNFKGGNQSNLDTSFIYGKDAIPKELQPLAEEARKYKTAEEFKKAVLNSSNLSQDPRLQTIDIRKIIGTDYPELDAALKSGKKLSVSEVENIISATDEYKPGRQVSSPIEVRKNNDGTFSLQAGNHRLAQKLINGETTIPANVIGDRSGISLTDLFSKAKQQNPQGGFANPSAFLGSTETPELKKSNVLPTIKPTSPQLGEPGYKPESLSSETSPSLDQSRSNPLLDTTISPTKIDNKVLSQSAGQPILSEPNISLTTPKQSVEALQSLRTPIPEQSQSGVDSQLQQQGTKNQISSFIDSAKVKANELYTKSIDRFNPISQLGKKTGQNQKIENAMTGYYGAASTANYHVDFELAPILKSVDPKDLRMAAIAQRDLELAGRDIKGSTAQADAAKNIEALQQKLGPEGYAKLKESLGNLYSYQDKLVQDYLVKTGIISPEAYAAMKANNQSYVPFKRVMDTVDEQLGFTPGKQAGSVSSQNVIKGIKGSNKEIVDPLQSIVDNTYKIVGLAKRQQVAQSIVNLKDSLPEGVISKLEGTVGNKATISLFENGKQVKYQVPQEVADAAKGMTEDQMGTIVKLLAAPTRIFRATATGLNPEFMLPNVTRDLQNAFVNVGLNPLNFVKGMSSLMKKDELYQDFLKSGGQTSTVKLDQPFLQTRVGKITGEKGLVTGSLPRMFEWIQKAGEYSEQPTRIAAFDAAKKRFLAQGLSAEEASIRAANAAQESTVNFARRGSETRTLNAVYAFLNARVQGVDRLVRSLKNDPKGAGARMAFLTVAPAVALYAHNRNFKSYADDRVISKKDKETNFIFMLSDTPIEKLGGAQYIKIPKAEIGKFANPVEQFLSYADGKGGDVSSALLSALKSFSPIDNAGDLVPTAVRPLAEDRANTNFFTGYDIVPSYKKNLPPSAQSGSTTAPLFKAIGDKTNLSPARLQNLAEGYGTGYTKIAEQLTQPILPGYTSAKNDRGADVNRTPVLRRFFGGEKKSTEEVKTDALNKVKAIKGDITQIKNGIKNGTINEKQGNEQILKLQKDLGTQEQYIKGPGQGSAFAGKAGAVENIPTPTAPLPPFNPNIDATKYQPLRDGTYVNGALDVSKLTPKELSRIKSDNSKGIEVSPEELKAAYIGPETVANTPYTKALQQKELLSKMSSIERSTTLSEIQKQTLTDEILKRSGLSQGDIEYYKVAKQSADLKSLYANEQLSKLLSTPGTTPNTVNNWLINGRKTVNGEQLLNDSVIKSLVDSGVIGKADGEYLKKVSVENGQVKVQQSKPKKLKMPKLKKIKVKKQKKIKLKPISLKLKVKKAK